jgi:ATPase subunit of ABC transporter with duplicated ATPase domains
MSEDPSTKNITRFSELEEAFREQGGYDAEAGVARLADGLGLRQDLLFDDINGLSGGQRRRVDLVRILFQRPDVMILDEPTNHLDRAAKRWLAEELGRFNGAMLVISHDLDLLDRSITMVLSLANQEIAEYKGNYSSFQVKSVEEEARIANTAAREGKEIARLATLADQMRGSTVRRARIAKSIDKRVERLRSDQTETKQKQRSAKFTLPTPMRSGETPLTLTSVAVTYGSKHVLKKVHFSLGRGDRVVVIGRNGAGKSSLLRCVAGVQDPTGGKIEVGINTVLGYFAQEHEQVDQSLSALDNIDDGILTTVTERRALLGSFGLKGSLAEQPASTLSGGERAKLGLAMLAAGTSNLLVLDEPNNNLDPSSVTSVGDMLARWPGTLLVVSHDRDFVEALKPTHSLYLPQERYDLWREEFLEDVESK